MDNAKSHRSIMRVQKTEELKMTSAVHLPFSPDVAPSDVYLLDYLKDQLRKKEYHNDAE
jgi:hypothetical protein